MSNVSQEAPITGAAGGRGIIARVAALLIPLAFALFAFADLSSATESKVVPVAAPTDGKTVEIAISNFTFTPNEVTIAPGTTVKWVNHDDIPHLVAEKALEFKSQALDTNDSSHARASSCASSHNSIPRGNGPSGSSGLDATSACSTRT